MTRDFAIPEITCPACQYKMNACFNPDGLESPSVGDLSVCMSCGEPLIFGKKLVLRKLESEEIFKMILEEPESYAAMIQKRKAIEHQNQR